MCVLGFNPSLTEYGLMAHSSQHLSLHDYVKSTHDHGPLHNSSLISCSLISCSLAVLDSIAQPLTCGLRHIMGVAAKVNPSETSLLTFRLGFGGRCVPFGTDLEGRKALKLLFLVDGWRCEYQAFNRAYHLAMTRRTTPIMQREVTTTTGLAEAISLDQDDGE